MVASTLWAVAAAEHALRHARPNRHGRARAAATAAPKQRAGGAIPQRVGARGHAARRAAAQGLAAVARVGAAVVSGAVRHRRARRGRRRRVRHGGEERTRPCTGALLRSDGLCKRERIGAQPAGVPEAHCPARTARIGRRLAGLAGAAPAPRGGSPQVLGAEPRRRAASHVGKGAEGITRPIAAPNNRRWPRPGRRRHPRQRKGWELGGGAGAILDERRLGGSAVGGCEHRGDEFDAPVSVTPHLCPQIGAVGGAPHRRDCSIRSVALCHAAEVQRSGGGGVRHLIPHSTALESNPAIPQPDAPMHRHRVAKVRLVDLDRRGARRSLPAPQAGREKVDQNRH